MGFGVGTDVTIERRGDELVLRAAVNPAEEKAALHRLVAKLNAIGRITDDYERDPIEFPDRPGLY